MRWRQESGASREEEVQGLLLAYNNGPVWRIGNEIVTGMRADHIRFPELPEAGRPLIDRRGTGADQDRCRGGAEPDVLNSAAQTLEQKVTQLIVETHSLDLGTQSVEFLTRSGYQSRIIAQAWRRFAIPETRSIPHNRWLVATKHDGC